MLFRTFQKLLEKVLNVLDQFNLQTVGGFAVDAVLLNPAVNKLGYLHAHFLLQASSQNPKANNSTGGWHIISLDLVYFFLSRLELLFLIKNLFVKLPTVQEQRITIVIIIILG